MKKNVTGMMIGAMTGIMVFCAAGSVLAAGVTAENAKKTALEAVGVTEDQVIFKETAEDLDDGTQIFEVDFFVPGEVKYEFDIDASTGKILEQDMDLWEADDDLEYASLIEAAAAAAEGKVREVSPDEITELQAKTIALKDAGFKVNEVTFTKCKKDIDDGVEKYEIEFHTEDFAEYDYDISVKDGKILEKDMDQFDD